MLKIYQGFEREIVFILKLWMAGIFHESRFRQKIKNVKINVKKILGLKLKKN